MVLRLIVLGIVIVPMLAAGSPACAAGRRHSCMVTLPLGKQRTPNRLSWQVTRRFADPRSMPVGRRLPFDVIPCQR